VRRYTVETARAAYEVNGSLLRAAHRRSLHKPLFFIEGGLMTRKMAVVEIVNGSLEVTLHNLNKSEGAVVLESAQGILKMRQLGEFGITPKSYIENFSVVESDKDLPDWNVEAVLKNGNMATTMANLVSPFQLNEINGLAKVLDIDENEECRKVMNCSTGELSHEGAKEFIAHLHGIYDSKSSQPQQMSLPFPLEPTH
jgi:hypothetical protein